MRAWKVNYGSDEPVLSLIFTDEDDECQGTLVINSPLRVQERHTFSGPNTTAVMAQMKELIHDLFLPEVARQFRLTLIGLEHDLMNRALPPEPPGRFRDMPRIGGRSEEEE